MYTYLDSRNPDLMNSNGLATVVVAHNMQISREEQKCQERLPDAEDIVEG